MPAPFKSRHVHELAGSFVLVSLVVVAAGVLVAARSQQWFTPMTHVTLELPEEGSLGLRAGNDVIVLGTVAGDVKAIRVVGDRMFADLRIRSDFMRFVRADSRATVVRTLGIGDASVDVSRGHGSLAVREGDTIELASRPQTGSVEQTLDQVRAEVIPAIEELRAGVKQYTALAQELRTTNDVVRSAVAKVDDVLSGVQEGKGLAGAVTRDAELPKTLKASLLKLQQVLDHGDAVTTDVKKASDDLPKLVQSLRQTSDALPGLILQAQESFRQVQTLTDDVRRSWLVRGFSGAAEPPPAPGSRIDAAEVGGPSR